MIFRRSLGGKTMKLSLSAVILTAVIGLVSCDSATNSLNKNTLTKSDLADAIKGSCKPGSVSATSDCKSEIPNSTIATKSLLCDATGTKSAAGPCLVSSCAQDYSLVDNACVVPQCQEGKVYAAEDCRAEIPFSVSASKAKECDRDGKRFVYEPCQVTGCSPGYKIAENKCIAQACTPNQPADYVDCRQEIPFSAGAVKKRICEADGEYIYPDICRVNACQSGYTISINSCIPGTCAPGQSYGDADCTEEIPFANRAWKPKSCNSSGEDFTYGTCVVSYCQYGYLRVENTCVSQSCNAEASYGTVDCTREIPFSASATKSKTCNASGTGYMYGNCLASECVPGFTLTRGGISCLEPSDFLITAPNTFTSYLPPGSRDIGTISWTASSKATKNYAVMVSDTPSCSSTYWSTTTTGTSVGVPLLRVQPSSLIYVCVRAINTNNQSFPASNDGKGVLVQ